MDELQRHHDVICIEAKKVFDFCFQEHRVDKTFHDIDFPENQRVKVKCEIDEENIICREIGDRKPVQGKRGKFLVSVVIEAPIKIKVVDEFDCERNCRAFDQRVVFIKQAVLCAPDGTDVECEVTGNCACFFDRVSRTVNCVFDFCVVIQAKANVKVLVPTFGICVPAECRKTVMGCPPRVPRECDRDDRDRDRDHHRHHDRDCDHDRHHDRDRDHDRHHDRDHDRDRDRDRDHDCDCD